jgi:hypothetical protein
LTDRSLRGWNLTGTLQPLLRRLSIWASAAAAAPNTDLSWVNIMRILVGVLYCICASQIAWADQPAPAPAAATPAQPTAAASATNTQAPATSTPTNASAKPETTVLVTAELEKKWRSQGYKPQKRGDETLWCRREAVIGSRFEEKKCWTAEVLEENERDSQHFAEELQHTSNPGGK